MNKLYRSRRDKKVAGLCGGLAQWLNIDATLLRVVVIVTAIFSFGTVLFFYIVASLVIPKEPISEPPFYPGGPFTNNGYGTGQQTNNGGFGYGSQGQSIYGNSVHRGSEAPKPPRAEPSRDELDEMMKEVEKKALRKEIDDLREKLSKYEKGDV
ncbi:MAG: PspC domain-containing protein [Gorillibacterium sp.]|nr:PspC domain-containing protein [Gorillibacterium sp.]